MPMCRNLNRMSRILFGSFFFLLVMCCSNKKTVVAQTNGGTIWSISVTAPSTTTTTTSNNNYQQEPLTEEEKERQEKLEELQQQLAAWWETHGSSISVSTSSSSSVTSSQSQQQQPNTNTNSVSSNPPITYQPGNLTLIKDGLLLSEGLTTRIVAQYNRFVNYTAASSSSGEVSSTSSEKFHRRPDGAAVFPDERPENPGGWIYVSNSEVDDGGGGVGAITFNSQGDVMDYKMLLTGTNRNCAGGKTPWKTWISCEEDDGGTIYQVDPYGVRASEEITLGNDNAQDGDFEAFTYDYKNGDRQQPRFYVTRDIRRGPIHRFMPQSVNWNTPWEMLTGPGTIEYLILEPTTTKPDIDTTTTTTTTANFDENRISGTYRWTQNKQDAELNALQYYPNCEGIDVDGTTLFFVSKRFKRLYELELSSTTINDQQEETGTYSSISTWNGLFDGSPDQIKQILRPTSGDVDSIKTINSSGNLRASSTTTTTTTTRSTTNTIDENNLEDGLLYFTEEGGIAAGVHARDSDGNYYTILEGPYYVDETTGLAFSPDGKHLYIAYQRTGILYDVTRKDGYPFDYKTLNVKYHELIEDVPENTDKENPNTALNNADYPYHEFVLLRDEDSSNDGNTNEQRVNRGIDGATTATTTSTSSNTAKQMMQMGRIR